MVLIAPMRSRGVARAIHHRQRHDFVRQREVATRKTHDRQAFERGFQVLRIGRVDG